MKPLLDSLAINKIVKRIGAEISHSYPENEVVSVVAINTESIPFAMDMVREIKIPLEFSITYAQQLKDSDCAYALNNVPSGINGKNVIVVLANSKDGSIISEIKKRFEYSFEPKSIQFCCLFKSKNSKEYINYLGRVIPKNTNLIGYGMNQTNEFILMKTVYAEN